MNLFVVGKLIIWTLVSNIIVMALYILHKQLFMQDMLLYGEYISGIMLIVSAGFVGYMQFQLNEKKPMEV